MKLKPETVFIFYDFPIVFSAKNETGSIFICLFADETNTGLKYLCREVSFFTFADLVAGRQDIRSIFEKPTKTYSFCPTVFQSADSQIEVFETTEDISPFLPDSGFYIGAGEDRIKTEVIIPVFSYSIGADASNKSLSIYYSGTWWLSFFAETASNVFSGDYQCLTEAV